MKTRRIMVDIETETDEQAALVADDLANSLHVRRNKWLCTTAPIKISEILVIPDIECPMTQ